MFSLHMGGSNRDRNQEKKRTMTNSVKRTNGNNPSAPGEQVRGKGILTPAKSGCQCHARSNKNAVTVPTTEVVGFYGFSTNALPPQCNFFVNVLWLSTPATSATVAIGFADVKGGY